jgi:glucose-6-phosphate 1-dehydrogenase
MAVDTTTIVIMGATGDLGQRKLLPTLFELRCNGVCPANLRIVGFARTELTDEAFREHMWKGVQEFRALAIHKSKWDKFAQHLYYVPGNLDDETHIAKLKDRLKALEGAEAGSTNRLFYLSISPTLFEATLKNMKATGIATEEDGWSRVVIEKPFGRNFASA